MASSRVEQPFNYDQFGAWYDSYREQTLEPALQAASTALDQVLTDLLTDRDLARIRNVGGRVKSKRRTWRKLRQPRYHDEVGSVDDIPSVIDDLVGLRITCINLRDLDMIQAALDNLPRRVRRGGVLRLDPASERNYVDAPKESGYRGWHVNLGLLLEDTPVTCELQIRTLLQDSWGELTHEDTYSKDGELPPLVEVLSKRMADLLATLDDIAEDLRTELDRIDEAAVAEEAVEPENGPVPDVGSGLAGDAAALLSDRWRALDRPVELSSLAWALQTEFGAEVSDDWFGHGSFKRFVRHAVPDGEISTGRTAYLLPVDDPSQEVALAETSEAPGELSVPVDARRLRRIDRGFPLVEAGQWQPIYSHLAEAWRRMGARQPTTRAVNQLTRSARDRAAASGETLSRRNLDYVAKAVLATTESGEPLDAQQVAEAFVAFTLQRMVDLRILDADDRQQRAAVTRWLEG